jgi:hypothetical protein
MPPKSIKKIYLLGKMHYILSIDKGGEQGVAYSHVGFEEQ